MAIYKKLLDTVKENPGCRVRTLADIIDEPPLDVIDALGSLEDVGLVRHETHSEPANMQFYKKWYA